MCLHRVWFYLNRANSWFEFSVIFNWHGSRPSQSAFASSISFWFYLTFEKSNYWSMFKVTSPSHMRAFILFSFLRKFYKFFSLFFMSYFRLIIFIWICICILRISCYIFGYQDTYYGYELYTIVLMKEFSWQLTCSKNLF